MPVYPHAITARLAALKYAGERAVADAEGRAVNFECGGFVTVELHVDDLEGIVSGPRFASNGCGYMVAAADAVCSRLEGAGLRSLQGLDDLGELVVNELGSPPIGRSACFDAVFEAVRAAFADHRRRRIEEFAGEKALICTCFGVAEETIVRFIDTQKPATVDEVSDACRAGSGCGSCRMLIQELLDVHEIERTTPNA